MIKAIKCNKRSSSSMNWVDSNNRLVGFEFSKNCCEHFGFKYCKLDFDAEAEYIENCRSGTPDIFEDFVTVESPDLSNAYFAEYQPYAERGKFKIEGSPDCNWLVLYNFHNGYYHHGFTFTENGKEVCEGVL